MSTQLEICNLALIKVGGKLITALNDGSKGADICAALWDDAVRAVLVDVSWPLKRAELTVSAIEPEFDWEYLYPVPSDFLDVLSIANTDQRLFIDDAGGEYDINIMAAELQGADVTCIVTNLEDAFLEYVGEVGTGATPDAELALFPQPLINALTWKLAIDLAVSIANSRAKQELALKMYEKVKAEARRMVGTRRQQPRGYNDTWIKARGGQKGEVPKITNYP